MEKQEDNDSLVDINRVFVMKRGSLRGTYLGPGAIEYFGKLTDSFRPSAVGFITSDSGYSDVGAWDTITKVLVARNIPYSHFDKVQQKVDLETMQQSLETLQRRPIELLVSIGDAAVT